MLTVHVIIALAAIGIVAYRPARDASAALVAALAVLDVALGAPLLPALRSVAPVLAFLTAALALASAAERSGIVDRAAGTLARLAGGRSIVLFGLACGVCAVVTAVVSLDGAVVLMVPLLLTLARRYGAPFAPLLLGTVAVANAASIAVPQGNPTNLVLMEQLGLSPAAFLGHMLLPGLAAGAVCAGGAALLERRALAPPHETAEKIAICGVRVRAGDRRGCVGGAARLRSVPPSWRPGGKRAADRVEVDQGGGPEGL